MKKPTPLLLAIFLTLTGVGIFLRSSFFNVDEIQIETKSPELKKMAEQSLEDLTGKNMWELEFSDMSALLSAKSRAVESVSFQRHWPNILKVKIQEREGVAQTFIDRELWVVDKEGISFRKKVEALPLFWPVPSNAKNFSEALAWLARDKPQGVNGLTWDKELGLILLLDQKVKVIMGRENFPVNWKKAREAVGYLKNKGLHARRIDATYNNRAVVSL